MRPLRLEVKSWRQKVEAATRPGQRKGRGVTAAGEEFRGLEVYFFSTFAGLHLVQVLPSFLAVTQHGCAQSLPAALAFSQQVFSALAKATLPRKARAQRRAVRFFMVRFVFWFCGIPETLTQLKLSITPVNEAEHRPVFGARKPFFNRFAGALAPALQPPGIA